SKIYNNTIYSVAGRIVDRTHENDIDDLLETKIGDLEWNGELAKEAENELKTHSKTDSRKADLKLEGTADVKDENKEQALLELLLRILGENEDKVRGISPGSQYGCGSLYEMDSQYGCGSLYEEMDEDHSTSQVKLACLFRWTHLA
ncbi:hypothetical protein OSTOST_24173, partial [Ostertagia ostertagi]